MLKSGCRTEARQLETADRLRRCLAVYSVLAWRILYDRHAAGAPLRQAVRWIGCLGGFLARRGDGEPGVTCCGEAFSISRSSRSCTGSCALPPRNHKMWVKINPGSEGFTDDLGVSGPHRR